MGPDIRHEHFSTHVRASEAADTQTVLEDVHAAIDKTGSFYFATVQVETECVDTQGADDIDITAGRRTARLTPMPR